MLPAEREKPHLHHHPGEPIAQDDPAEPLYRSLERGPLIIPRHVMSQYHNVPRYEHRRSSAESLVTKVTLISNMGAAVARGSET